MNILQKFVTYVIPTRDMKILELRKTIKELEEQNYKLKNKANSRINEQKLFVEFYDEEIEKVIISNLMKSKSEICISMYNLTSYKIMEVLNKLKNNGINIKIIVDKDKKNKRKKLQSLSNYLKIANVYSSYSKYDNYMHNKYCIIDNKIVLDGSYNWSYNARFNVEHIIVINNTDVAKMYRKNFDKIFNNSRYYDNYSIYENIV